MPTIGEARPSRSSKRSRLGCPECRKKKIKCDEVRPVCGQCQRSRRRCRIVDNLFRPHVLSSQKAQQEGAPRRARFEDQSGIENDDDTVEYQHEPSSGRQFVEPVSNSARHSVPSPEIEENFDGVSSLGPQPTTSRSQNFNGSRSANVDEWSYGLSSSDGNVLEKLEESFFLRYFSESIAPWFDVVNFQRYFGHECIVLIREYSLLRFAACALAAKQLGHASISNASAFRNNSQRSIARQLLQGSLDFGWYGAKYYDKAIKTLARQITPRDHQPLPYPSPSAASSTGSLTQSDMMTRAEGEDPIVRLLATCVLIQYESLSGNTKGWSGHLNGFDKLLSLLDDGSLFYTNPLSQQIFDAKSQRALRAAFWWFAINDLEESFVARRKMRIDLDNLSLWRHMGLHMYDDGEPINLETSETPGAPPHLQEDLLSFALIRSICKLVTFLALQPSTDATSQSPNISAPNSGTSNDLRTYQSLQNDLDKWYASATAAFLPDTHWRLPPHDQAYTSDIFSSETWYSHSFRAVTMLYYHTGRMLLLIHQPPSLLDTASSGPRSPFDMLKALRDVEQQLQRHATDIVSIVNGMLDDGAVRVRAIQPLFVAGRSLTEARDRRQIVEMIRGIQDDLGVVCEYRVRDLLQEWGIAYESLGLQKRQSEQMSDVL